MKTFYTIVKSDYLQRTRSYAFLVTICISLAFAYTLVPEPNASYSTIRISNYVGYYNSAWFGYVTAIMTSVFLSITGFYLVNSGIKKDLDTNIGQIIASTPIKNFSYLLAKAVSNFAVLMTIILVVFFVSILLFVLYNDGYSFEPIQFIKPYLIITVPTMFFVSALAVFFEVIFRRHSIIQNIIYFFAFMVLLVSTTNSEANFNYDVFGGKIVTSQMEKSVQETLPKDKEASLAIGFVINGNRETKKFLFNGVDFPTTFLISRLIWMLSGLVLLIVISPIFHRFDIKRRILLKKSKKEDFEYKELKDIVLSDIPAPKINYGILSLIKTEAKLLFRSGRKWMWIFNLLGFLLLVFVSLKSAHQFVLPILWFLQVGRLSSLTTKETENNVHYFAFSSYKPLSRLLLSQIIAAVGLMLVLASPLIIRYLLQADLLTAISIILGGVFIVSFASLLGILTKGKKLFEILFFLITYANINAVWIADYFGALSQGSTYLFGLLSGVCIMLITIFSIRKFQLNQ